MNLLLISLVPIVISLSFIFQFINNFFANNSSKMKTEKDKSVKYSDSPDLWGTYRSNLYFGMRTKTPQALLTGLAWNSIDDIEGFTKMRHSCDLDDQVNFGWKEHNGRTFGFEKITDQFHQTSLSISFLKVQSPSFPSREAWTVKIGSKPLKRKKKLSLIFYLGYNGDSSMELKSFQTDTFKGYAGWTPETGNFVIGMKAGGKNPNIIHDTIPKSKIWMITDKISNIMFKKLQEGFNKIGQYIFMSELTEYALLNQKDSKSSNISKSNVLVYQFIIPNDEDVELFYFPHDGKNLGEEQVQIHLNSLTKAEKQKKSQEFTDNVIKKFNLKPNSELIPFVKYTLSNLLGGISYFYGDSLVFSSEGGVKNTLEGSLFTDVPARANFPRGFYWDSGFHNILISKWDLKLSLEIICNWIDKIDESGWIGREQILGDEARSKVPEGYIVQNPNYSNPPASLLPIEMLTNIVTGKGDNGLDEIDLKEIKSKLKKMYPKLVSHFNWFLETQRATLLGSPEKEFLFRWRGRLDHHTLTSGLDDYPRGNFPSEFELHVDLLSWMAFASRALLNIKNALDITEPAKDEPDFEQLFRVALRNLNQYHWDESRGCFSDVTVNDDEDGLMFVPNVGYVSLFPMLFGLLKNDDPKLQKLFDIIEDPKQLWTDYGIRSLSLSDPFYNEGDQYWTGPIWINLNYLILSSIKKYYYDNNARGKKIYNRLRKNLIENMNSEWKRTGFIWEQYNDLTGKGQRSRPFSGWSSLIVLIIAEDYH